MLDALRACSTRQHHHLSCKSCRAPRRGTAAAAAACSHALQFLAHWQADGLLRLGRLLLLRSPAETSRGGRSPPPPRCKAPCPPSQPTFCDLCSHHQLTSLLAAAAAPQSVQEASHHADRTAEVRGAPAIGLIDQGPWPGWWRPSAAVQRRPVSAASPAADCRVLLPACPVAHAGPALAPRPLAPRALSTAPGELAAAWPAHAQRRRRGVPARMA